MRHRRVRLDFSLFYLKNFYGGDEQVVNCFLDIKVILLIQYLIVKVIYCNKNIVCVASHKKESDLDIYKHFNLC